jgi:acetoacetyl-CoA reductase
MTDKKTWFITGAGRGMGVEFAKAVLGAGHNVVATGRNPDAVAEAVGEAGNLLVVKLDVTSTQDAETAVQDAVERFGRIDVLVNNAGINIDRTIKNLSPDDWNKVIQNDLNSYFYTVKAAQPYFTQQGSGKIINISSFVGQAGNFGQANYSAAKAGIIGFTKTAALEFARSNVTVNAICPGFIETDMFAGIPEKAKEAILKRIPLGRTGTPQEIARAVRYLIVDGDYITGQTLNINGGIYMD